MIKINRSKCPKVLLEDKGHSYNNRSVVKSLYSMQHGKCCYCEQKIPDEGHMKAVEHFHPKSVYKGQVNDWENLLLICAQCNGKKSDKFPVELTTDDGKPSVVYLKSERDGDPLLIDPSDKKGDDPEKHLEFILDDSTPQLLGLVVERNGSQRGRITIDVTGIASPYYCYKRQNHYDFLMTMYLRILKALREAKISGRFEQVNATLGQIMDSTLDSSEFAAFSREFIRKKNIVNNVKKLEDEYKYT